MVAPTVYSLWELSEVRRIFRLFYGWIFGYIIETSSIEVGKLFKALHRFFTNDREHDLSSNFYSLTKPTITISSSYPFMKRSFNV